VCLFRSLGHLISGIGILANDLQNHRLEADATLKTAFLLAQCEQNSAAPDESSPNDLKHFLQFIDAQD
jgi:hypothetical protein